MGTDSRTEEAKACLDINRASQGKTRVHQSSGAWPRQGSWMLASQDKDLSNREQTRKHYELPASRMTAPPERNTATSFSSLASRLRELFAYRRSGQPEIVWVTPLSHKLAQPRNTEEFL